MLHAWTLEYQHMMLCVWWWIPTKAERQWSCSCRKPPGHPRNVWLNKVQEDATLYWYLCCGDLRSPWVTEWRDGSLGLRDDNDDDDDDDDNDDDEEWLVSKMEGKTNFSRHLQAVRNRDCWVKIIDVGCNLKVEIVWCRSRGRPKMYFSFSAVNDKCRRKCNSVFGRKRKSPAYITELSYGSVILRT